jgi:hypothetical protein
MSSWYLGLGYLSLGLFVESYNVTLYWLKESVLKNWLLGFLPHEGSGFHSDMLKQFESYP